MVSQRAWIARINKVLVVVVAGGCRRSRSLTRVNGCWRVFGRQCIPALQQFQCSFFLTNDEHIAVRPASLALVLIAYKNVKAYCVVNMSRPELVAPPEIVGLSCPIHSFQTEDQSTPAQYYGDIEAKKYTNKYVDEHDTSCGSSEWSSYSSRVQQIQADMTYRALELLNLPPDEPAFLLDIGCGSGLSGEILDEEGYNWIGVDIAPSMLGMCQYISDTILSSHLCLRRGGT